MKSDFTISKTSVDEAKVLIRKYHYLKDIFAQFDPNIEHTFYGLYRSGEMVGAVQYCRYKNGSLNFYRNHFGCTSEDQNAMWEITRLAVSPIKEYNITSWFLSRTMKMLREDTKVDCILTVADARLHTGCIYAACNFDYYGLMKGRVHFMEQYHFHVFNNTYNGIECLWAKQPFDKDCEITL